MYRQVVASFLLGAVLFTTVPVWGQDLNTLLVGFITDLRNGSFTIGTTSGSIVVNGVQRFTADASTTNIKAPDGGAYLIVGTGLVMVNSASFQIGTGGTGRIAITSTAPTISSGFGTTPSIVASNGTAGFTINVGTGGVATSGVIGLPTATTGWAVQCADVTTNTATVFVTKQTATSTASATIGNFDAAGAAAAWVASDVLVCSAMAY